MFGFRNSFVLTIFSTVALLSIASLAYANRVRDCATLNARLRNNPSTKISDFSAYDPGFNFPTQILVNKKTTYNMTIHATDRAYCHNITWEQIRQA